MDNTFNLSPDRRILAGMLLINVAGYAYEQNPAGMHPFRKRLVSLECKRLQGLAEMIPGTDLPPHDYIRLINSAVAYPIVAHIVQDPARSEQISKVMDQVMPGLIAYTESPAFNKVVSEYNAELERLPDYSPSACYEHLRNVIAYLKPADCERLGLIQIHINLLDSYRRGTNYVLPDRNILCTSLKLNGAISWSTLRHELIHVIVRRMLGANLVQYSEQAREYLVLALQLAFDPPAQRERGLQGFVVGGYSDLEHWLKVSLDSLAQNHGFVRAGDLENMIRSIESNHPG